jgi:rare lipoprotein A
MILLLTESSIAGVQLKKTIMKITYGSSAKPALVIIFVFGLMFFSFIACREKPAEPPPAPAAPVVPEVKETKTGMASFYGRAFDGQKTTSGEIFDSDEMVAAHPSYPFGTIVRVTNISTNDTVRVRIHDRGPTKVNRKEGVIIDLSRGAAKRIKMIGQGRAKVKVEVLEWGDNRSVEDTLK